ncbi:binding-protein-dependent transport systems inner membrane component [Beutenbergia cavernae DSM 12333]|uniref:Binding-protein-dependent transport systems inner membrane component n=1 Tax=Beutenbergia cavernae (strain ATCC BAA-8 / DSM 12333 / CCUG 43141 / JCM 11478 / NBRC 16432 / NCIMB 13614 / HKI 0122) TaxID=471853 RepID=C5BYX7_BEUC1|nr:sugar ABC transporter permease [Beutenbergia cavernae]ACQ81092.1 binding-protein-dependent transport systems inner membrane component [Beutenbergia cavernae DSM 12333]
MAQVIDVVAEATHGVPRRERTARARDTAFAWALLAPAFLVLVAFTHYPVISSVLASTEERGGDRGFANYERMINDPVFWKVVVNNIWFALGTVPTSMALAILMAVWVNGKLKGRGFVRLAYFTPTILPMVAVASIWLFFYSPGIGPIDQLLTWVGLPTRNWLGDPSTAMPALMVMMIWKLAGFFMIFYLAGLQSLSPELEEASTLEGASRWYHFRRVTFPLLAPTTLFVFVVAVTDAFKIIDHLFIMTSGGPNNATNLLLYYIYDTAFTFFDPGYAGALTLALVVILGVVAVVQFGVLERRVHYR